MTYRPNPQDQGWTTCRDRLLDVIAKWQKRYSAGSVEIDCPARPRYQARFGNAADRAVSVTFTAGKHVNRTVTVDRFERPVDNLWALAVGLDDIRLNELRGLDDVARQVYQALPAPTKRRDPYEVLGVRPDAPAEVVEASYKALAKRLHPDVGGSDEAMRELNEAMEAVKAR